MSAPTFNRPDTLLGVCEAIGQDLGVNANWLRVALAVGVFWSLEAALAAYLALGVMVVAVRLLTPARGVAAPQPVAGPAAVNDDEGPVMLAEAA